MTLRRGLVFGVLTAAGVVLAWLLFVGLPRWYGPPAKASAAKAPATPVPAGRKIIPLPYPEFPTKRLPKEAPPVPCPSPSMM